MVRTREDDRDQHDIDDGAAKLADLMPRLDQRLGRGPFLGGDALTFADVMVGHLLYRYMTLGFPKAQTPNVDAYYDRLSKRPAYIEHVMVSYESLRAV